MMKLKETLAAVAQERFIVSLITEPPGAVAILGLNGGLLMRCPALDVQAETHFAPDSFLAELLHILPSRDNVAKVCINLPKECIHDEGVTLCSRDGVGYLVHVLRWVQIPTIVTRTELWRPALDEAFGAMTAVEHLKTHHAQFFKDGELDALPEQQAQALLLAYTARNQPDWEGIPLKNNYRPN